MKKSIILELFEKIDKRPVQVVKGNNDVFRNIIPNKRQKGLVNIMNY